MKVKISFTLELDQEAQEAWIREYGTHPEDLRDDIITYYRNDAYNSLPVQDLGVKVV